MKSADQHIGVGSPAILFLEEFGSLVWSAFGSHSPPFLVGSAAVGKQWRDVDVRLILSDIEYAAAGFGDPTRTNMNSKWCAMTIAFSILGKHMTGLPIDFQIQQATWANKKFQGARHALGCIPLRYRKEDRNE